MEKSKFDGFISERLKEETSDIKMSSDLRQSILNKARSKKPSLYDGFHKLMNTTVEISIPSVMAACFIICIFGFSAFSITSNMEKDDSIMGYTSIKTVNIGGVNVIIDSENEVDMYEKNKN